MPTVSCAVIEELVTKKLNVENDEVKSVDFGITPGWKVPRGIGTTRSILETIGKPVEVRKDGGWVTRYGWGDSHVHKYPDPLGDRYLANLNVPDLTLFPKKYPRATDVRGYAGLELPIFHLGTAILAQTFGRMGVNLGAWPIGDFLHKTTEIVGNLGFGTGNGGMYVRVVTWDGKEATWNMLAKESHSQELPDLALKGDWPGLTQMRGPRIPCLPAVLMAHHFVGDTKETREKTSDKSKSEKFGENKKSRVISSGAGACVDYITYDELSPLFDHLGIQTSFSVKE